MLRAQDLGALGVLAAAIFDVLCFIENDERKFISAIEIDIPAQNRIGRDEQVVVLSLRKFLSAVGTGEVESAEMGRESCRFSPPVCDEAGGADDEGGCRGRLLQPCTKSERLKRFPEAMSSASRP